VNQEAEPGARPGITSRKVHPQIHCARAATRESQQHHDHGSRMVASNEVSLFVFGRHSKLKQQKSMFKQCSSPLSPESNMYSYVPPPEGPDRRAFPFFLSPLEAAQHYQQLQQQQEQQQQQQDHHKQQQRDAWNMHSCAARRGRTLPSLEFNPDQEMSEAGSSETTPMETPASVTTPPPN